MRHAVAVTAVLFFVAVSSAGDPAERFRNLSKAEKKEAMDRARPDLAIEPSDKRSNAIIVFEHCGGESELLAFAKANYLKTEDNQDNSAAVTEFGPFLMAYCRVCQRNKGVGLDKVDPEWLVRCLRMPIDNYQQLYPVVGMVSPKHHAAPSLIEVMIQHESRSGGRQQKMCREVIRKLRGQDPKTGEPLPAK